ncbi:MAG: serine/threonine-protein kinase [bacterium]
MKNTFGNYFIIKKIAVAGMAEIFLAKKKGIEGFEKLVVIKRILGHLSDNKDFIEMFIDEAKIAADLSHPNIIYIDELGKIEDTYYIAMEYIYGKNLSEILKKEKAKNKTIPIDIAFFIAEKMCSALDYAHKKKSKNFQNMEIVHRDVSPSNILISYEGEVKLSDFGIARATSQIHTTTIGLLKGKIGYMSPEQAMGQLVDKRTDIYALGIIIYEMLTGRKVFEGDSEFLMLEKVKEGKIISPRKFNSEISHEAEKIILKALQKPLDKRYQNAYQMWQDIVKFLHEHHLVRTSINLSDFVKKTFEAELKEEAREEMLLVPLEKNDIDGMETEVFYKGDESEVTKKEEEEKKEEILINGSNLYPKKSLLTIIFLCSILCITISIIVYKLINNQNVKTIISEKTKKENVSSVSSLKAALKINSYPSQAKVIINDKEMGITPFVLEKITFGKYTIKISKSPFNIYEEIINVKDKNNILIEAHLRKNISISSFKAKISCIKENLENTSLFNFPLPFGINEIKVERPNFVSYKCKIEIQEDGSVKLLNQTKHTKIISNELKTFSVNIILSKYINIISKPENADVKIDGQNIGQTPIKYSLFPDNSYEIFISKPEFHPFIKKIYIENDEQQNINIVLNKLEKIEKKEEKVEEKKVYIYSPKIEVSVYDKDTFQTIPSCEIKLADERNFTENTNITYLLTSQKEIEVPTGKYILFVKKYGYDMYTKKDISLKQNDKEAFRVYLMPIKGKIIFKISPENAYIYLDDVYLGQGIVVKEGISFGMHTIKITHSSYASPKIQTISITDKKKEYKITMKEESLIIK